jgi:hypothetical protein
VEDNTELCAILEEALAPLGHVVQTSAGQRLAPDHPGARPTSSSSTSISPASAESPPSPRSTPSPPTARVIMVSGTHDDTGPRTALAHGAFDYVVEAVDLNRITEIVDLALLF